MKIYDKVQWHTDAGESAIEVITKMKMVFSFLNKHHLLSDEGMELFQFGIDSSASLNENMVSSEGKMFLNQYYDQVINANAEQISIRLEESYSQFKH